MDVGVGRCRRCLADGTPVANGIRQRPMTEHFFTIDVEEYFQVSAFEQAVSRNQWDKLESRVVSTENVNSFPVTPDVALSD